MDIYPSVDSGGGISYAVGEAHYNEGRYDPAYAAYTIAIKKNVSEVNAWWHRGQIYYKKKKIVEKNRHYYKPIGVIVIKLKFI